MAAKITEGRKRTLFPSDKAAEPTRPQRTMSPSGKPSPHTSGSASESISKTHGEEPGSIPIHLGSFGSSQAVASGPEGRQTIAQRVNAGFRPPMKTSPGGATDSPLLHTPDSISPLERIPHARFAQDARTPRQARHGIQSSSLPPSRTPSCPKLIFTPRRRARRGWNTLHHGLPGRARSRCSNARPRLRSRETR
jgi:hypothetical protein